VEVSPPAAQIAAVLRRGERPSERHFDRFLPVALQASSPHWTPLAVALKTAAWFRELGVKTVVDVGAGAGKPCVAIALASECELTGIEQRAGLVAAARELAQLFAVADRVRFVHAELASAPLPAADAYYLYNPFGENLLPPGDCIDRDVELNEHRHQREVAWFERQLALAPPATYVVEYAGFGGRMPAGYRQLDADMKHRYPLRLWQRSD
jgi:SAM-dependent methyltransferase